MRMVSWEEFLDNCRAVQPGHDQEIERRCRDIIHQVTVGGDQAVRKLTRDIDGIQVELELSADDWDRLEAEVKEGERQALETAAGRIREFHERQVCRDWFSSDDGIIAGQIIRPVNKVGVYVPGGRACYPSSVLMCGIPAVVAGVTEIVVCTPPQGDGLIDPLTALACRMAGITRVFRIGGAQAIAAMAVGTDTVPRVDVVCGPGNVYVMTAKRLVRGLVGTDADAGPSELLVVADDAADPVWAAWDVLAQAEHDPEARLCVVTTSLAVGRAVERQIGTIGPGLRRWEIIKQALAGAMITVAEDLEAAVVGINAFAAEHVALHVHEPWQLVPDIESAGSIVVGRETPVAVGDYGAGPNHVLPTGGTARFGSPLGVQTFQKRCNLLYAGVSGTRVVGKDAVTLAMAEGLTAHAGSVQARLMGDDDD